jgi:AcrR family transcriptional regulator
MARPSRTSLEDSPLDPVSKVNSSALREKRRRQIVDAATLALARSGFAKTGVKDIAQYADVSIGLVYEYVRTKEDILLLVFEHWTNVWVSGVKEAAAGPGNPIERLGAATGRLTELADRYRHVTHLFYHEAGSLTVEARERSKLGEHELIDILSEILRDGVREGHVRPDVNPTLLAANLLLLTHGWALKGYIVHSQCHVEDYARWLLGTMLCDAVTPAGRRALKKVLSR